MSQEDFRYRRRIHDFRGRPVRGWTVTGTKSTVKALNAFGDAGTFRVPDGAAGMAVMLEVAWLDDDGKIMESQ